MAKILETRRKVAWSGTNRQHEAVNVDGIVIIIDKNGREHTIPFRAEDKGGTRNEKKPEVWEWINPQDPMGDITIGDSIRLESGEKGKIVNGQWVGE